MIFQRRVGIKLLMIYLTFFIHTQALKSNVYLTYKAFQLRPAIFPVLNTTYGKWL